MTMLVLSTLAMLMPEAGAAGETCEGLFGCTKYHFEAGALGMYPILAMAIFTAFIIVERLLFLSRSSIDKTNLISHLKTQIMSGNLQGAAQVCASNPVPLTRIIHAGLQAVGQGKG